MESQIVSLITNGQIHDAVHANPYQADIAIRDGRIYAIGKKLDSYGGTVIDAKGMDIFPGFIDAHTHIGLFGFADPNTKDDVEKYKRCTPENRAIDAIDPQNIDFGKARRGGVTTVCDGPGSVNCIGGTFTAIKTFGSCIDDMIIKDPVAMKIAFGENPKNKLLDPFTSRMTNAACIREYLYKSMEYLEKKELVKGDMYKNPAYHAGFEAMIPVIQRKIPMKAHVHRASDIFTAIRIAKEFNIKLTLEHVSDGAEICDKLAAEGYPICAGPFISTFSKVEAINADPQGVVSLIRAGCHVCVQTDFPVIAENNLPLCAGMLIREGLDDFEALKTITINAAEHIEIADRVGSIEIGKDADLVISLGNPLMMGTVMITIIDGVVRFENTFLHI